MVVFTPGDEFYDICDELGLLVWQDFMYACSMYPVDDAFMENAGIEAEQQVKRLHNHPCIALWVAIMRMQRVGKGGDGNWV